MADLFDGWFDGEESVFEMDTDTSAEEALKAAQALTEAGLDDLYADAGPIPEVEPVTVADQLEADEPMVDDQDSDGAELPFSPTTLTQIEARGVETLIKRAPSYKIVPAAAKVETPLEAADQSVNNTPHPGFLRGDFLDGRSAAR